MHFAARDAATVGPSTVYFNLPACSFRWWLMAGAGLF
jgi:hypothetical protein